MVEMLLERPELETTELRRIYVPLDPKIVTKGDRLRVENGNYEGTVDFVPNETFCNVLGDDKKLRLVNILKDNLEKIVEVPAELTLY